MTPPAAISPGEKCAPLHVVYPLVNPQNPTVFEICSPFAQIVFMGLHHRKGPLLPAFGA